MKAVLGLRPTYHLSAFWYESVESWVVSVLSFSLELLSDASLVLGTTRPCGAPESEIDQKT